MTRAIITQLVEALETGWSPQFTGKDARALSDAAIKAAREYLATEPIGERAELIADLRRIAAEGMADYASTGYPNSSAIRKAADMLEADAQPKKVTCQIYGHVVGACVECNTHIEAQQAKPYDQQSMELCDTCGWKGIFPGEPCLVCAQQAKRVPMTPADKPTDWSAA